jgi:hypothetical protein
VYRRTLFRACAAVMAVLLLSACDRASAQEDWQTFNTSRQAAGEDLLRVKVEYGAGTLTLSPAEEDVLYSANIRYDAAAFTPVHTYRDGELRIGFESGNVRGRNLKAGHLNVHLSQKVPVELQLQFGAAEAELNLGGVAVRRLDVQTGASRTRLHVSEPNSTTCTVADIQVGAAQFHATGLGNLRAERLRVKGGVGDVVLDFTGDWAEDMSASVEMGLGSLTLRLPDGLPVRIVRSGRLASFDGEGLTRRGETYTSAAWDEGTAAPKLSLNLSAALGSVRVTWVDSQ